MKYIFFIFALLCLAACSFFPAAVSDQTAFEETAPSHKIIAETTASDEAGAAEEPESGARTLLVKEKFEQDGRWFVSVRDQPGDAGNLIQVEIREKFIWDAIKKGGAVTFDKAWKVIRIDWIDIEEIKRDLETNDSNT